MSLDYWLGVATLPALAGLFALLVWICSPPNWFQKGPCPWCPVHVVYERDDHPHRPWWVWRIIEKAHQIRYRERAQIKAWQAEHTSKPHWWSRRVVVR